MALLDIMRTGRRGSSAPYVFAAALLWMAVLACSCAAFEFKLERALESYTEMEVQAMLGEFQTGFKAELDNNRSDNKYLLGEAMIPCNVCQDTLLELKTTPTVCNTACISAMHYGLLNFKGRKACDGLCDLLATFQLAYNPCYAVGVCEWERDATLPNYRPVVLMHGVNSDHTALYNVSSWIQEYLPNIYVHNVELGDGKFHSIFTTLDKQVEEFAAVVAADPMLAGGFNLLGFSQGTLITRGYIQKFNNPPVYNYVSFSGPQGGQYGIPYFNINFLDGVVNTLAYRGWAQDAIGITGYWRDPYKPDEFLASAQYLPDLNNIKPGQYNATYKRNILSLNTFVMSYSQIDDVIVPPRSGWFEFFQPNSRTNVTDLKDDVLYANDTIGLRTLDETGRLVYLIDECTHSAHESDDCGRRWFINDQLSYLDNTLDEASLALVFGTPGTNNNNEKDESYEYRGGVFGSGAVAGVIAACVGIAAGVVGVTLYFVHRRKETAQEREWIPLLDSSSPITCPPDAASRAYAAIDSTA